MQSLNNPVFYTKKIYIQEVTFSSLLKSTGSDTPLNMIEPLCISDMGECERQMYGGKIQSEAILRNLTKRQQKVAQCLAQGYTRKQTADKLHVSLMAIHRIIPRMRERLSKANIRYV